MGEVVRLPVVQGRAYPPRESLAKVFLTFAGSVLLGLTLFALVVPNFCCRRRYGTTLSAATVRAERQAAIEQALEREALEKDGDDHGR